MLASLLPGLRELRAPLAAGYVWLLALWLSFSALPVQADYSSAIYRPVIDLANWAGKPAIFAASAFTAYLVGVISNSIIDFLRKSTGQLRRTRGRRSKVDVALRDAVINRLSKRLVNDSAFQEQVVNRVSELRYEHANRVLQREVNDLIPVEELSERVKYTLPQQLRIGPEGEIRARALENHYSRSNILKAVIDTRPLVEDARRDLDYVAPRLLGKEDAIYGEYDRLMSEGQFRVGMFLPMCYLFGSLSWLVNPWWALGLLLPSTLLYLGVRSHSSARQNLALAIVAERIESPALEHLASAEISFASYENVVAKKQRATLLPAYVYRHADSQQQ